MDDNATSAFTADLCAFTARRQYQHEHEAQEHEHNDHASSAFTARQYEHSAVSLKTQPRFIRGSPHVVLLVYFILSPLSFPLSTLERHSILIDIQQYNHPTDGLGICDMLTYYD